MNTITTTQSPVRLNTGFLFDLTFSVFTLLICLIADPIVLKSGTVSFGSGMLTAFKIFAYTAIAISLTALGTWLIFRRPLAAYSGYLDDVFIVATRHLPRRAGGDSYSFAYAVCSHSLRQQCAAHDFEQSGLISEGCQSIESRVLVRG